MTQASTSAANFGLLLVALVLMLGSVVGELTPRHVPHHLFAREDTNTRSCLYVSSSDVKTRLMIKDDHMKDFKMKEPTDMFSIRYPNLGGVQLFYYNFDPSTGCKDIKLLRGDNKAWRIWVSDEHGNDRDIDTKNHAETTKTLCSKWIHIHVKRDG
ncbi:related to Mig1 protein, induced during biotrophic phase [Ustilago bromivora]|uniref:Related to Mig1 protein, induced during biotrophic phase n=1 Tax=Ustilago bromivora TaxID=307758 RepID=A0A8H8QIA0_9BASI|nr:related to Mig1 protein, induced during biotrophic phase [Ustilago bromivora]